MNMHCTHILRIALWHNNICVDYKLFSGAVCVTSQKYFINNSVLQRHSTALFFHWRNRVLRLINSNNCCLLQAHTSSPKANNGNHYISRPDCFSCNSLFRRIYLRHPCIYYISVKHMHSLLEFWLFCHLQNQFDLLFELAVYYGSKNLLRTFERERASFFFLQNWTLGYGTFSNSVFADCACSTSFTFSQSGK